MSEALNAIVNNVTAYVGNSSIIWLFVISAVYILIADKDKRKSIIYPTLILMIFIINPLTYMYVWKKLLGSTYWRTFWMIPVVVIIAYAFVKIVMALKNVFVRALVSVAFIAVVVCCGVNIYKRNVNFEKAENAYKLSEEVLEVCDVLLEENEEPKVVMTKELYSYARQYSTNIQLMYGRNAEGFISSYIPVERDTVKWLNTLDTIDLKDIYILSKTEGYNFWVVSKQKKISNEDLNLYGYVLIGETKNYKIYRNDNM
jgi:hypothetical protein